MVSPTELVVTGDGGKLTIPAGDERQISYVARNNGSLPGSHHTVLALVEYSGSGQHELLIAEADVAIAADISSRKSDMIIAGAGIIVLLFAVVLFIEFRIEAKAA
jgi:hypothetical protein